MADPIDTTTQVTQDEHKGAAVFHSLLKDVPAAHFAPAKNGHSIQRYNETERQAAISKINEAYSALKPDERMGLYAEAKQYFAQHNMKSHIASPRADAAVFVYQTAVLEEVREINTKLKSALGDRYDTLVNEAKETNAKNPKAHVHWADNLTLDDMAKLSPEERGKVKSATYHQFQNYSSALDAHSHPDGLYGPVTDRLNSQPIGDLVKPKLTEKKPEPTPEPAVTKTVQTEEKKPDPVVVTKQIKVEDERKPENILFAGHEQGIGKQTAGEVTSGTSPNKNPIYTANPAGAKLNTTTDIAGIQHIEPGKTADLVVEGFALHKTGDAKTAGNPVNIGTLTSETGAPNYLHQNGNLSQSAKMGSMNFTGVGGGVGANLHTLPGFPDVMAKFRAAVGQVNSSVSNAPFTQSGVNVHTDQAVNTNPLADPSHRAGLGYNVSLEAGTVQKGYIPSFTATASQTGGAGATLKTFNLKAEERFHIAGNLSGFVNVGYGTSSMDINHTGTGVQSTTVTTTGPGSIGPDGPIPGQTTTSVVKRDVSQSNSVHISPHALGDLSAGGGLIYNLGGGPKKSGPSH